MEQNFCKCNGCIGSERKCKIEPLLIFCKRFRNSCCIQPTNFKNPKILPKIVGFLKVVGEMQQFTTDENIYRKLARTYCALHFTSYLSIALSEILPHLKIIKTPRIADIW